MATTRSAHTIGALAAAIRDLDADDATTIVRLSAEFLASLAHAKEQELIERLAPEPEGTGDHRWDVFLVGIVAWRATTGGVPVPPWTTASSRFLGRGWWVSPMRSMRAWEWAGTPLPLKMRGIYIHRDSLTNV